MAPNVGDVVASAHGSMVHGQPLKRVHSGSEQPHISLGAYELPHVQLVWITQVFIQLAK